MCGVCPGMYEYAGVCTMMCECALMCVGVHRCVSVFRSLRILMCVHRYARVCVG